MLLIAHLRARRLKQCLGFYQIATRVPAVYVVPFPKAAQQVLSIFEVFNVNISGLSLPLSCIGLGTYPDQMLFTLLFPIVIAACILLGCLVSVLCGKNSSSQKSATRDDRRFPLRVVGLLALPHLLTLSFLVFPMVSSTAFQAFSCEEFDNGKSFLRADYAIECNTPEHDQAMTLAVLSIMLYPVGVSLLYILLFWQAKGAIASEKPTALSRALGFLTNDFEKPFFWWELFEAWKKLVLVGFFVLLEPGTMLQLLVAFVFSLLCMLATAVASPFVSDVDDSVAKVFGFALATVFFFALVIKVKVLTESWQELGGMPGQLRETFKLDIVIISISMTVAVALSMVMTMLMALQQLVHAVQTPVIKLRSASARPALTVTQGITWHLFLSQCAMHLEL